MQIKNNCNTVFFFVVEFETLKIVEFTQFFDDFHIYMQYALYESMENMLCFRLFFFRFLNYFCIKEKLSLKIDSCIRRNLTFIKYV